MPVSRRVSGLMAVVLLIGCDVGAPAAKTAAPASKTETSPKPDSHARMVAELETVRRESKTTNSFFQDASVSQFEGMLASLPPTGAVKERFALNAMLSEDFRRLGRSDKAVAHLLAAEATGYRGTPVDSDQGRAYYLFESGVTYLRLAETENCVYCRTGESCILPIRPGGVHRQPEGSRKALEYFKEAARLDPTLVDAKWLMNVTAMTLGEYPDAVPEQDRVSPEKFRSSVEFPRFLDISANVGLKTVGSGGGAIADDFDGDGRLDLMVSGFDPSEQMRYFRNVGDGTFEDRTNDAGLTGLLGGINMAQADFDNDGNVDVLVMRGAWLADAGRQPCSLLRSLGGGRFRDVTFDIGLEDVQGPMPSAAWGDYDLDGDLDVYFCQEAGPCRLFRNESGKRFEEVSAAAAGIANERFTKGAVWGDYDGDRWPDLYVTNLDGPSRLYHNEGNGRFTDVAEQLGVTGAAKGFPTWFWDVNNDGRLDIFASSYDVGVDHVARDFFDQPRQTDLAKLYLGKAEGGFEEVGEKFGLTRVSQPMGANFGDLDNDGFPDFYLGTGYPGFSALMPNLMYRNRGGTGFDDVTFAGGFGHLQKGHGVAFADFDDDGDQDVFTKMGGAYPADAFGSVLFENPGFSNRAVRVKLIGVQSNRSAIGARIRAAIREGDQTRNVYKWVDSGGTFGGNPLAQQIGVGKAEMIDVLEIFWPATGETQRFEKVPVGGTIEIREGETTYKRQELKAVPYRK